MKLLEKLIDGIFDLVYKDSEFKIKSSNLTSEQMIYIICFEKDLYIDWNYGKSEDHIFTGHTPNKRKLIKHFKKLGIDKNKVEWYRLIGG